MLKGVATPRPFGPGLQTAYNRLYTNW